MKELVLADLPDFNSWSSEYHNVPWEVNVDSSPEEIYNYLSQEVQLVKGLPDDFDSFKRPYRAAMLLDRLIREQQASILRGFVAYSIGMLKEESEATKSMGGEFCRSMVTLSKLLSLPDGVIDYMDKMLEVQGQKNLPTRLAGIVEEWSEVTLHKSS